MGCRVNGPGETDDADLGLWCGPTTVHAQKKDVKGRLVQLHRTFCRASAKSSIVDRGAP
jgi:4-hydroxy-3-methylbut-2-en-1-yl diphosphate synthase IspG/GcpE